MKAAGEAAWTNATHLVVAEPGHPRMGGFLRGADLGWANRPTPTKMGRRVRGAPGRRHAGAAHRRGRGAAVRVAPPPADGAPGALAVRSALWLLRETRRKTLDSTPRSAACRRQDRRTGPALHQLRQARRGRCPRRHDERRGLLHRLCHRHAEHAGRQPERGGRAGAGRRSVSALWRGPTLQHRRLRQPRHAQGVGLSRNRFPYEKSSEFKRKKAAGQPAYPAAAPWYPATGGLSSEMLASALAGYPYRARSGSTT